MGCLEYTFLGPKNNEMTFAGVPIVIYDKACPKHNEH